MIVIIDYGCGNLLSLKRALDEFKIPNEVSKDKTKILNAELLILPGVGAFENAMNLLKKNDLINTILEFTTERKKPLIGICLGMQILFEESEENLNTKGFGIIKGVVRELNNEKHSNIKKKI